MHLRLECWIRPDETLEFVGRPQIMFRRSFLQKRHQTVVEFLVGSIMRTQEVIKCRTLFIHFLHVQRLPVQAANCVTVLKSLSSCETQTVSLWLATRRTLAALQGFTDVWLHKTNVSTGEKAANDLFPPAVWMWGRTRSCLLITQPPKNVYYKASRGENHRRRVKARGDSADF